MFSTRRRCVGEGKIRAISTSGRCILILLGRRVAMAQPAKRGIKALVHGEALRRAAVESEYSWERFLRGLAAPQGALSPQIARQAQELWQIIEHSGGEVHPPFAAATETGGLSMTWDRGRHHFEIEVLSDGTYDLFFMDTATTERAGVE